MRGAPITIRCDCGQVERVPYGQTWTCPDCGRRWNTEQIPAEEYWGIMREMRRYRLQVVGVALVLAKGEVGDVYNIGAGNETPNRVLVDKLLALFGAGEEMVDYVEDRPGHDRRYSVNVDKVTALGWRKARTLDEALVETVEWYRANEWWWRPLKERAGLGP